MTQTHTPSPESLFATSQQALANGDVATADDTLQSLLAQYPDHLGARRALGRLYVDLGRWEDAIALYSTTPKSQATDLQLRFDNGTALLGGGYCEQALSLFSRQLDEGHDRPAIRFMHARALLECGEVDRGKAALDALFRQQPSEHCLRALANALWMQADDDAFDDLLQRAIQIDELQVSVADLSRQSGDVDMAISVLQKSPPGADRDALLAQCLIETGDGKGAETAARAALQADAGNTAAIANLVSAMLMNGKAQDSLAITAHMRQVDPLGQHWIAYEATALRMSGDERYDELVRIDDHVRAYSLPIPEGFDSLQSFNAAFRKVLATLQPFERQPLDQSLRNGTQTSRDLARSEDATIKAYFQALDNPVRQYLAAIGDASDHPMTVRNTGNYRFAGSWSVKLRGGGRHVNHVHPEGWISSAYYVNVPERADDHSKAGCIKFGEPPFSCEPALAAQKWIRPEAGMLVLFPSFLWHGTEAILDGETRITAPFDLLPDQAR